MPVFDPNGIPVARDIMLMLDSGTLFCAILFGMILLKQWYTGRFRRFVDLKLAWSIFFFGFAMNTASFMMSTYWMVQEPLNTQWVTAGYVSLMLALTAFFFAMERILPYRMRHAFTLLGLSCAFITLVIPREFYTLIAFTAAVVALGGILLFLRYSLKITSGDVRRSVGLIVASFVIGWTGFVGRSDFVYYNLGQSVYIVGLVLLIFGATAFGYLLTYSVALDELDWRKQLVGLYLIQEGGLLIFHYDFEERFDVDQVLTAAGISGIQSLFQEITKSEQGLNIVSIGNYQLLFAHGRTVTGVLIAKQPYQILLDKVQDFVTRFELILGPVMGKFSGPLDGFYPAKELAESIFREKLAQNQS
jgi:hypothetical protein